MSDLPKNWIDGRDTLTSSWVSTIVDDEYGMPCEARYTIQNFILVPREDALKLNKENADLKQDYDKLLKESKELTDLAEKIRINNMGLRERIKQYRKDILNPKNNSMTLFEKFDELFEDELK